MFSPLLDPSRDTPSSRGQSPTFGAPGRGLRRVFNLDTVMAASRAERLARRTASAATAPERHVDPEPHVEHAEDNNDHRPEYDLGEEEASSVHPSRERTASSLGRPAPGPATALLMAHELLQYRPTPGAHDAWINRLTEIGRAHV